MVSLRVLLNYEMSRGLVRYLLTNLETKEPPQGYTIPLALEILSQKENSLLRRNKVCLTEMLLSILLQKE